MNAFPKVKPTFSVLFNPRHTLWVEKALEELERFIGGFDLKSEIFHFKHLENYYSREMGYPLFRLYLSGRCLIDPSPCSQELNPVSLKLFAMRLERKFTPVEGKRVVNIDPGYVDRNHLFLTTRKERGGRTYLRDGVFLEMEYLYFGGDFKELFWTYPDYKTREVKDFFKRVRGRYLKTLRGK
jgi:hypothetical protein